MKVCSKILQKIAFRNRAARECVKNSHVAIASALSITKKWRLTFWERYKIYFIFKIKFQFIAVEAAAEGVGPLLLLPLQDPCT